MMRKYIKSISVLLVILFSVSSVSAATLTQRLADGHKLRLGFGTAVPWAYAGDNGEALGFVNMIALTVLEEMGITEHETKVFEWSGLIPGIKPDHSKTLVSCSVIPISSKTVKAIMLTKPNASPLSPAYAHGTAVPNPSLNLCPSFNLSVNVAALTEEMLKRITRKTVNDLKNLFIFFSLHNYLL